MTYRQNAALAAIAFVCLPSVAPAQDHVQMRVSTRGLHLDSATGLAELDRRIHVAARVACDDGGLDLASFVAARACRDDLEHVGAARIAELAAHHDVMLASATGAR